MNEKEINELKSIYLSNLKNKKLVYSKNQTSFPTYSSIIKGLLSRSEATQLDQDYFRTIEITNEIDHIFDLIFKIKKKEKLYEYLGAFYLIRSNDILSKELSKKQSHLLLGKMFRMGAIWEYFFDEINKENETQIINYEQIKKLIKCLAKEENFSKYSCFYKNLGLTYLDFLYSENKYSLRASEIQEERQLEEKIEIICGSLQECKLTVGNHRFNENNPQELLNQSTRSLTDLGENQKYPLLLCNQSLEGCEEFFQIETNLDFVINYLKAKIFNQEQLAQKRTQEGKSIRKKLNRISR